MTFPTPFVVDHYPYTGSRTLTIVNEDEEEVVVDNLDELGNEIASWADEATKVAVQGWQTVAREKLGMSEQGVIADVAMSVPPTFTPGFRDRIGLPDGLYEVIEVVLQCNGFHGWSPGNVVLLKRVSGV